MIKIKCFGSGSKGNGYLLDDGRSQLLIECGIPMKKVIKEMNFNMSHVEGCLITHEHKDHCEFVDQLLTQTVCNVYGTKGTVAGIKDRVREKGTDVDAYRFNNFLSKEHRTSATGGDIPIYETDKIGTWFVTPFHVHHDAAEPVGFLIDNIDGDRLVFITDTYYVNYTFPNVSHLMVEMNYSKSIIEKKSTPGTFSEILKSRIVKSHFEMSNSLDLIKRNKGTRLQEVWLLHLSDSNSDEALFKKETQRLTGVPVYIA